MFHRTDFPSPMPSFPFAVPLVNAEPSAEPLVCVKFNENYLPYVLGCLLQLELQATWNTADETALDGMIQRINDLIYIFQKSRDGCTTPDLHSFEEFINMPAFRDACDHDLFYKGCDQTEHQIAFKDDIQAPSEVSEGTPQPKPGGGTQQYCNTMHANGKLVVDVPVSTGDTIEVLSQSGIGNDGGHAPWRDLMGNQIFGGLNVHSQVTDGSDPMPAEYHMSLIVDIGGTFHSLEHGTLTVPSGITSVQPVLQVNDSNVYDNFGDYQICIKVTNNKAASWTHTWDFTLSPGAWVAQTDTADGVTASYVPGVGWQSANGSGGFAGFYSIIIELAIGSPVNVDTLTAYYNNSITPGATFATSFKASLSGSTVVTSAPSSAAGDQSQVISPHGNIDDILFSESLDNTPPGVVTLTKIIATGTGTDPF